MKILWMDKVFHILGIRGGNVINSGDVPVKTGKSGDYCVKIQYNPELIHKLSTICG
ncbi:MAG: hypothetical protein HFG78_08260 [Hungatella sp.]|nr:hypothetical protein [Hungatella sp.]MCI9503483.1 hypothetical protein [Hungatella sp.]MCI9637691.1 hypothetical protein [Hungatella sp.]